MEAWVVGVGAEELADDLRASTGAAIVTFEPAECLAGALKARRIDEGVQRLAVEPHRIGACAGRGARLRGDRDVVVLRKRRDDTALAFVWMTDNGENRMTHAAPVST